MTLVCFPFDLCEVVMQHFEVKQEPVPSRCMLYFKKFKSVIPFTYLMWDEARQDSPGLGSTALVVVVALSGVVVFGWEVKTLYTTFSRAIPEEGHSLTQVDVGRSNETSAEIGNAT